MLAFPFLYLGLLNAKRSYVLEERERKKEFGQGKIKKQDVFNFSTSIYKIHYFYIYL